MILPIDDTAPVSAEAAADVDGDVAAGAGAAGAEAAAAGGAGMRAALMMSSARISPPGPDPRTLAMSTLCSRARRRALGEILAPATDAGATVSGAAGAAAAAGAASILRPLCCGAPALAGTDSPAFNSHAMICPTGTTSSTLALTPASTPSAPA